MPERARWRAGTGKPFELVHDNAAFYKRALRGIVWVISVSFVFWLLASFVHEFAHAIHRAVRDVDPGTGREISALGVPWWFFSNDGESFSGNTKVETPEEFMAYDPRRS